ncbi:MAG: helix-turn-helix domain-containing protein [Pyramidobacter sp.]|jgi:transcriptional regulator with XRE-family HTH domain
MSEISVEIGKRIHRYRKLRNMTLDDLALKIYKSRSTLSKYEKGEIVVDVATLYEIADALLINVDRLLYQKTLKMEPAKTVTAPSFFKGVNHFFSYYYDGYFDIVVQNVFDIQGKIDDRSFSIKMYMNIYDPVNYNQCENTYSGTLRHFEALTIMQMTNDEIDMEKAIIQIPAPFRDAETKWGLYAGFSNRPMMPIAYKMLFSKTALTISSALRDRLKITKADMKLLKSYNMLAIT